MLVALLLCLFSSAHAFDLSLDHPYVIPEAKQFIFNSEAGSGHREIEYEAGGQILDNQLYKSNEIHGNLFYAPADRLAVGLLLSYDTDREYELRYKEDLSRYGRSLYRSSSEGFLDPELAFVYEFNSRNDSWNQQLFLSFNPMNIKVRPGKNYRGGNDVFLDYRFSHRYDNGVLYSKLFSHYFGTKTFYQPGDHRLSNSDAYTEVGVTLGYLFKYWSRFSINAESGFGLSSDYIVNTPELSKSADKGFLILFNLGANFFATPNFILQAKAARNSRVYNANNEALERNIDYEVEEESMYFGFVYKWGKNL